MYENYRILFSTLWYYDRAFRERGMVPKSIDFERGNFFISVGKISDGDRIVFAEFKRFLMAVKGILKKRGLKVSSALFRGNSVVVNCKCDYYDGIFTDTHGIEIQNVRISEIVEYTLKVGKPGNPKLLYGKSKRRNKLDRAKSPKGERL